MLKFTRILLVLGGVKDLDERGKLSFKDNSKIENSEKLKKMKHHWQSFADSEESERDKYLRELEIQFSMDEFVDGSSSDAAKGKMASVVVNRKSKQQKSDKRNK